MTVYEEFKLMVKAYEEHKAEEIAMLESWLRRSADD